MAAGDYRMGLDGAFLYGSAGSTPAGEADNVDNVNLEMSARMAEALRRNKKFVSKKPTYLECSLSFSLYDIEGDVLVAAIRAAFVNKTRVAMYPKDADSGEGLNADWYISKFSRTEDNEGYIMYAVTAEPTDELRDPTWA